MLSTISLLFEFSCLKLLLLIVFVGFFFYLINGNFVVFLVFFTDCPFTVLSYVCFIEGINAVNLRLEFTGIPKVT